MTVRAIVTMIVILAGVWGSMGAAMVYLQKTSGKKDAEEK